jgi:ribosomal protein S12 methylthiotransferase
VDGCVYINHETDAQPGDVVMVEVENAEDFDLWGRIVGTAPERKRRF